MVLIKGSKIVDGSGKKEPYQADVLIDGGKISAIGNFPNKKAETVLDGLGLYLAPGFIDVNTDSDHHLSLFTNPVQQDFIRQGVTTIFGGMCGSSLAPLVGGNLRSIRKWTDISQVNVDWNLLSELLSVLAGKKLGVNFGTLVGHSTIRRGLLGEDQRSLSEQELATFKHLVENALAEGAFGVSTGLSYAHARGTPYGELKAIVEVVAKKGGIYATHLRDERHGVLPAVQEALRIFRETGVNGVISHFRPLIGYESEYNKAAELIHQAGSELNIHYDIYPFSESVVPIYTLLPEWARRTNLETMQSYIENPEMREGFLKELFGFDGNLVKIAQARGYEHLLGKTIHQIADSEELNVPDALLKIMRLTKLRAMIFHKNINRDLIIKNLERDQVLIASNGASLPSDARILKHERFYNTFPKFLEIVTQNKLLSLPQAVGKITASPAEKYGLKNRGRIAEGWAADLSLITYQPGSVKVRHVLVNGRLAMHNGEILGMLSGKILRKGG